MLQFLSYRLLSLSPAAACCVKPMGAVLKSAAVLISYNPGLVIMFSGGKQWDYFNKVVL